MAPTANGAARGSEIDDLFNYDAALDDAFGTANAEDRTTTRDDSSTKGTKTGTPAAFEVDTEIKISRRRQPIGKLDENRLLSQAGVPKLRSTAKNKLKFRGKNHEFSDMAKLLNLYQLWLDDLYPRAKFMDALAMVEQLGHKKRMHVHRRNWIDESKPNARDLPAPEDEGMPTDDTLPNPELSSAMQEQSHSVLSLNVENTTVEPSLVLEEDELDRLLDEGAADGLGSATLQDSIEATEHPADEFADDLEAMADYEPS